MYLAPIDFLFYYTIMLCKFSFIAELNDINELNVEGNEIFQTNSMNFYFWN